MKLKAKILSSLFIAMLVIGMTFAVPKAFAATTVEWVSGVSELGNSVTLVDVVGDTFTMAIVVKDVADFYGFDVQANWNTAYVRYVSHTVTSPEETYPAPNPPSTYKGALKNPILPVKNIIDEDGGIPDADPASYGWFAYAAMLPAVGQDGDACVVTFTFTVYDQAFWFGGPIVATDLLFHFTTTSLANSGGTAITHTAVDFHLNLWPREFSYPALPVLDVTPKAQVGGDAGFTFPADVTLTVSPFWDVAGFDFILHYDPTLIKANVDTIDPDGWFESFWPGGIFVALDTIDNVAGEVHVAFLGLPDLVTGAHVPPYGTGRLLTVTFESIYVSTTYPPPECDLAVWNPPPRPMPDPTNWDVTYFKTDMAGYPHPERSYSPWNGAETAVPIPHEIYNGHYTAKFQPLGRNIDLYTCKYPLGFNGVGPNVPSDAFGPQATVYLCANVTYNLNPVQQKDVLFAITSPTGEWQLELAARTDANGHVCIYFGLPWPCDDPEGRVFGIWNVIATVDIREVVVNDTMAFQVGYLIDIVSVEPNAPSFAIGDHLSFKVSYTSISHQVRQAYFSIVVYDELDVPIAWFHVGPFDIPYGDGEIIIECKIVPKHTFVGLGHVYTNIKYAYTPGYYVPYCPQNVIPVALTIS